MKRNGLKRLVLVVMGIVSLSACSGDDAYDDASMSLQEVNDQKAQIMALAEKYDLNVTLDESVIHRAALSPLNMDSLEADFQRVASIKGKYVCVGGENGMAVYQKEQDETTPDKRLRLKRMMGESSSGSFDAVKYAQGKWVSVYVSWSYGIEAPGTVTVKANVDSSNYDPNITGLSYHFYGMQSSFTFECTLELRERRTWKVMYEFKISGSHSDGHGSIYVS